MGIEIAFVVTVVGFLGLLFLGALGMWFLWGRVSFYRGVAVEAFERIEELEDRVAELDDELGVAVDIADDSDQCYLAKCEELEKMRKALSERCDEVVALREELHAANEKLLAAEAVADQKHDQFEVVRKDAEMMFEQLEAIHDATGILMDSMIESCPRCGCCPNCAATPAIAPEADDDGDDDGPAFRFGRNGDLN